MPLVSACIAISDTFVMIPENDWNVDKNSKNIFYTITIRSDKLFIKYIGYKIRKK